MVENFCMYYSRRFVAYLYYYYLLFLQDKTSSNVHDRFCVTSVVVIIVSYCVISY